MEIDMIILAIGIAAAGFFIGDGLKNFGNPNAKNFLDVLDDDEILIPENEIHDFIGIAKDDVKHLIENYPDIPHIMINDHVYYPREKLRKWLENIG